MKKDTIIGIGAIIVAIIFLAATKDIKASTTLLDPGPRLFPYIAEIMMIICGAGMVFESLRNKEEEKAYLSKEGWKKLGIIFSLLILYSIALSFLGFLIATPFMFTVLMQMLNSEGKQPWVKVIVISLILTALIYIAFAKGFAVSLPKGSLF